MNGSEIEYLEARLPVGLRTMPSPEQMDHLIARARTQRAQLMSADFARLAGAIVSFARAVRNIAVSCTAARLRLQNV